MPVSDFFSSVQSVSGIFRMSRSEKEKKKEREWDNKLCKLFWGQTSWWCEFMDRVACTLEVLAYIPGLLSYSSLSIRHNEYTAEYNDIFLTDTEKQTLSEHIIAL